MPTKEESKAKIMAAEKACEKVLTAWRDATVAFNGTVSINRYGIFRDRFELRLKLLDTQVHINAALQALDAVDWPDDSDYEQLGETENDTTCLEIVIRREIEQLKSASVALPDCKEEYINQGFRWFALWMNLSGFGDDDENSEIDEMRNYCTRW